jgi:hypothetical protein
MRFMKFILPIIAIFTLVACDKTTTEEYDTEELTQMLPTVEGKYITYRVDSVVFSNFGTVIQTHKYQIRQEIDTLITDNLGRPSYRVICYLRDEAGLEPWVPTSTYFITHLDKQVEVIENNLRVIRLRQPFRINFNWKGNKYLSEQPYHPRFQISIDDFMNTWDFTYDNFEASTTIGTQTVDNVYTVFCIDESLNNAPSGVPPVADPGAYGNKTFSLDKYARGLGLVYRDYSLWEYQPPSNGEPGKYSGFAVKMWMIDHN